MIQIFNVLSVLIIIISFKHMLRIEMNDARAASALAAVAIIEIVLANIPLIYLVPRLYFWLLVLILNPMLEEFIRVKFSPLTTNYLGNFFGTSLMIGSLEAITKTFVLTSKFDPDDYISLLNYYILLSAVLSITLHLSFGIILLSANMSEFVKRFILMSFVHSTYNLVFLFTEPEDLISKNIQLAVVIFLCALYLYGKKIPSI